MPSSFDQLSISRSSFYSAPRGESTENLAPMRRTDELLLKYPFYGSRQMARQLLREGISAGRHRVRRLMRLIGLEAIDQAPRTRAPHPPHRIYPYLRRNLTVVRPDHVWCADTSIPVRRLFLYLIAIRDWATRHVLAWRLSNTMDAGFCVEALREAMAGYGKPEIFNTDQGSQFTSLDFTGVLKDAGITISMDGRGLPGQHLHRTPVALAEIRGRLSARDDRWIPSPAGDRRVDRLLQYRAAARRP